jgi:hypothetical protein
LEQTERCASPLNQDETWEAQYAAHCAEKEAALNRLEQREQSPAPLEKAESWKAQYAAYCADKESVTNKREEESNASQAYDSSV